MNALPSPLPPQGAEPLPRQAKAALPAPRLAQVAVLLAAWLLATMALRPLLLPDEGRYVGVAYEMFGGSALVPTLGGLPFFHKPPLLYWLDLAAMHLFGVGTFAARLGPALMAWALGLALFAHLRSFHGARTAQAGLVVLATSPLFYFGAQYVNHDMGVAACITLALLAWLQALREPGQVPPLRWLLAGWAACALGVLAKGLIGVVLPLAVLLPWLAWQRRWREALHLFHPLGLLLFTALMAPWLLAMERRFPGFAHYFIVEQHFHRFTGHNFNNQQPPWFLFVVLPLLMLPWSPWLAPALPGAVRRARAEPLALLYAWWALVIVGFFSLPQSKLVGYVMPALAPLAALLALELQRRGTPWPRVGAAAGVACLVLAGVLAWLEPGSHRDLGRALAQRAQPGDTVVFVEQYFYDVPFYARMTEPAAVVSEWDDPELPLRDNWRKELADAAKFAAPAARERLWSWQRLRALTCAGRPVWLLAAPETVPELPLLPRLHTVLEGKHAVLLQACGPAPQGRGP